MVNISCVHTGAGADIYGIIEKEIKNRITVPCTISHFTNPTVIREVSRQGSVGKREAATMLQMYSACLTNGADIILNMCSSVGDIADSAKSVLEYSGCRIIRIDNKMCQVAVDSYNHVGLVATLHCTMDPSRRLLKKYADEQRKNLIIEEIVVDGAFGLYQEELEEALIREIEHSGIHPQALIFAQASMSRCAESVSGHFEIPVFTSPCYAAQEVAESALQISLDNSSL